MRNEKTSILIVPGYADSGPNHWQSVWLANFPNASKVVQKDWIHVDREAWVRTLDAAIRSSVQPVILVGHSLGCSTIILWANSEAGKKSIHKIKGALLVAVPDPDSEAYRSLSIKGFDPLPMHTLPFPSTMVVSANDPYLSVEKARYYADCFGSGLINVGKKGHLGGDSEVGDWNEGKEILKEFLTRHSIR